jgi:hypothetical protein
VLTPSPCDAEHRGSWTRLSSELGKQKREADHKLRHGIEIEVAGVALGHLDQDAAARLAAMASWKQRAEPFSVRRWLREMQEGSSLRATTSASTPRK